MCQLVQTRRLPFVALVYFAAFAAFVAASPVSAETQNPGRRDMEAVCLAEGGLYYEDYENGVLVGYGCYFPDGAEWQCDASGKFCWYIMSYPTVEENKAPQPTDPTGRDHLPPVKSAPADGAGYGYQIAAR